MRCVCSAKQDYAAENRQHQRYPEVSSALGAWPQTRFITDEQKLVSIRSFSKIRAGFPIPAGILHSWESLCAYGEKHHTGADLPFPSSPAYNLPSARFVSAVRGIIIGQCFGPWAEISSKSGAYFPKFGVIALLGKRAKTRQRNNESDVRIEHLLCVCLRPGSNYKHLLCFRQQ